MSETQPGLDGGIPLLPGATLGPAVLREALAESQEEPSGNAQILLSHLTGLKKLNTEGLTQADVEGYFETVVFPALMDSRQRKNMQNTRKVSQADIERSMEKRLHEVRLYVQGLSYSEVGERVGAKFHTVRTNIGTTMLLLRHAKDTYDAGYFQAALSQVKPGFVPQEYAVIKPPKRRGRPPKNQPTGLPSSSTTENPNSEPNKGIDRPAGAVALASVITPAEVVTAPTPARPSARERARVSTRPRLNSRSNPGGQNSGRRTVSRNPVTGQTETGVIREPWWLNSEAVVEVDWEQMLEEYTSTWTKLEQDSLRALLYNKTGEVVQAAKDRIVTLLSAYMPERPVGIQHKEDVSLLEWETVTQLVGYGLEATQVSPSSEEVAIGLFHKYERQQTTFEETITIALIKLIKQEATKLSRRSS